MVGLVEPNPLPPKQPEKQPERWWSSALSNPVQVMRPAKGMFVYLDLISTWYPSL